MSCWWYRSIELNLEILVYTYSTVALNFTFFEVIAKSLLLCMYWGNPLANVSEVVDNPLINLLQWVKGYKQSSGKLAMGY
jgi:hypothetical protein